MQVWAAGAAAYSHGGGGLKWGELSHSVGELRTAFPNEYALYLPYLPSTTALPQPYHSPIQASCRLLPDGERSSLHT